MRKFHAPVTQDYLRELEKLKQSLAARSHNKDAAVVQAEIDKIRKLTTTTGLLPFDSLDTPAPAQSAEDAPRKKTDPAILLAAGGEIRVTPDLSSLKNKPTGKALPIGAAEWKVEKILPGNYYIAMRYSCAGVSEGATIMAKIGGNSVQHKLTAQDTTGSINEFRFAKLGVITVDQELTKETLLLQNSDPAKAVIWVRQVILTKVKAPENK